ncbi:hypothetical protein [Streptomyces gardneri]|uniref:hypothetical protein n=1 Tax=Streptomyces gardneri TaxID=66892 RepID=UPI0036A3BCD9
MAEQPSRLAIALTLHQAWWEDNDMWDGYALYLDEDTAKEHAARDYIAYEYCCNGNCDDEGTDEHAALPELTWSEEYGRWHLLADGVATNVQVSTATVYRTATEREIRQQDALHAAEKAERANRPQRSLTEAFADIAAARASA